MGGVGSKYHVSLTGITESIRQNLSRFNSGPTPPIRRSSMNQTNKDIALLLWQGMEQVRLHSAFVHELKMACLKGTLEKFGGGCKWF